MSRFEILKSVDLPAFLTARGLIAQLSVIAALGAAAAAPASAVVFTWDGGSLFTSDFSDGANWDQGLSATPGANDSIRFGSGDPTPNNNISGFHTLSITFNPGAASFTLGGNRIDVTTGLGVRNQSFFRQTVNTEILLDASQTWSQATSQGSLDFNGRINLNGRNLTFSAATNSSSMIDGQLVGNGSLTKTGAGTLALRNNSNTYVGTNFISQGVLQITSNASLGNLANQVVLNGSTLRNTASMSTNRTTSFNAGGGTFDTVGNLTHGGVISGSSTTASLTKTGDGTLTLQGVNTYNGGTVINHGTVSVSRDENLGANARPLTINNGATLQTTQSFANSRATTLGGTGGTIDTAAGTLTHTGAVSGARLTKEGAGTLRLTNFNNYTGGTIINQGTVAITDDRSLGATNGALTINNGATLQTTGTFTTSNRTTTLGIGGGRFNTTGAGDVLTYNGAIGGVNSSSSLTKTGAGTMVLNGNTTHTGDTHVEAGTLRLGNHNRLANASAVNISGGATLDMNNFGDLIGGLSGTGKVTLGLNNNNGLIVNQNAISTFFGVISGHSNFSALTKQGAGTLVLSGANTYTGDTVINQGTVNIAQDRNLGATSSALTINNLATLRTAQSFTTSRTTTLGGPGGTFNTASGTLTHSGVIGGARLTKTGVGTLNLTGINTYAGGTTINQGTVAITDDRSLGAVDTALTINNGATLQTTGTFATSNRTTTLGTGGGRFSVTGANDVFTHTGQIVGTSPFSNLIKTGAGTMVLNGSASYTGATFIEDGTLQTGGNGRLADASVVNITSGATLDLNNFADRIGGLSGAGNVTLGSSSNLGGLIVTQDTDSIFSGVISGVNTGSSGTAGGSGLRKEGTGVLTLSGSNTYTGDTNVDAGTLRIGSAERINDASILNVNGTGIFDLNNNFEVVGGLSGNGTVALGSSGNLIVNQADDSIFSGTFTGTDGSLFKRGVGKLTLSGLSTHTGTTFVQGGVLEVSEDRNLGQNSGAPPALFFDGGATLRTTDSFVTARNSALGIGGGTFDTAAGTTLTLDGLVIGSGALNKTGDGTLVLANSGNFHSGDRNINQGTLRMGASNVFGDASHVKIGAAGTFDNNGFSDTVGAVTNDGNFALNGGALIVTGKLTNNATAIVGSNVSAGSVENGFGAQLSLLGTVGGALDNNGTFDVTGTATIGGTTTNIGDINIAGGKFLRPDGGMDNFGSVNLTGGAVAGPGTVTNFATIQGKGAVTAELNNSGQVFANGGGVLTVNNLAGGQNDGELRVQTGSILNVGAVKNAGPAGLVVGAGNVIGAVENNATIRAEGGTLRMTSAGNTNTAAGVIEAGTGNTVQYTSGLNANDGLVALTGGAFDNNGNALTNSATGRIEGRGTVRTGGTGLSNDGQVSFVNGNADVFGNVQNNGGGRIDINDAAVTFFNTVVNDGTLESNRSNVSFLGGFVNNGTLITDPNTLNFTDWTNNNPAATIADLDDVFSVSNDILGDTANNVLWDTAQAILRIVAGADDAHTMELYGIDLGASVNGLAENFAWGALELGDDQTLSLADVKNDGEEGALYLDIIDLAGGIADIIGGEVQSIFGNGFNIYYNAQNGENDYLGGLTYDLQNGGQLIALNGLVAEVPAPGMILIFGIGLAGLGFARRKRAA